MAHPYSGPEMTHEEWTTGLNTDQDPCPVSPDLGPNCLQRISADDKSCCKQGRS